MTQLTVPIRADVVMTKDDELRWFAAIVESSEDAIISKTVDGVVTSWNEGAERIFGYAAGEMLGRPVSVLIPLDRQNEEQLILDRIGRNERVDHFETKRLRKDGQEIDVSVTVSPLRDAAGKVIGASKVARDITERKRAEASLHASEQRFRDLAESLPMLVWTCRGDGPCDYLSPQWVAYTGVPEQEQLGYGWLDQIHPDDRAATIEHWRREAARGGIFDLEFRIRRHDGVYRWFKTRATPLRDAAGHVTKWFGSNTDVQDLRDAQEQLSRLNRELEERVVGRTEELQAANDKLKSLAAELALAQRITHVGSWTMDYPNGKVAWSEELVRLMGVESRGRPTINAELERLFTPPSWSAINTATAGMVQGGSGFEVEVEIVRPSGEHRWTIARGQALRDASGQVHRLVGTFQDVTELAQARRERDRAAERTLLATSAVGMGIWDWNVRDNVLTWDQAMYALYGADPNAFEGAYDAWRSRLHPDDRAAAETAINDALSGKSDFDTAFRVVRPGGEIRYLRGSASVHCDESGKAVRMVGVNWDETAFRNTEIALRNNDALLREFVRHAPAAIAMLDHDLRYLQTSEQWVRDYKLAGKEIIGRSHYEIFPDLPDRRKQVHQRVLAGAIEQCAEERFPRADGTTEWLQWEARPWRRTDGTIGGLILFTQVITARKEMEIRLQRQKGELQRSNQDLEQFAYAASHDLQEPLRAISGCAQILQSNYQGKLDAAAMDLIHHMVDGAERMRTLIQDLLSYARVGTHGAEFSAVDSAQAVRQALANLDVAIRESRATIEVTTLPVVRADPSQLAQLFQNLVGNALKYRSAVPPLIRIQALREQGEWVFSVRDNGIGIGRSYYERIFVLFQRLHTRGEYSGTGIGLALCKRIVERHGGRIWVESQLGQGSDFRFTLPAGDDPT